ncbi:alpha-protein kinase vwkA-like [Mizuhopecten yessoensis]|uniref:Alpha-protein kinase 1 n=1 Tax=Mizuhopecten yessoensis TaxID=6573 RepID=A0A210PNB5_MIZYE|nr:alpha-protein kinase vwkA-like [Mizuhopecten yessoensis]XP_021379142.1 alpha-protein kinase vwkA-like [Mizuhopecten yessoensis]OWF37995.1 Alpha-protein kinase 1 [Mizuhopecten yessoensis]
MGQQYSVETLTASDESDGGKYWSSFEPYPSKVGGRKLAYLGLLNGGGPKAGEKCIVKVLKNGIGTYADWNCDLKKARAARDMAKTFGVEMKDRDIDAHFNFIIPILAEIDEVSMFTCMNVVMRKPRKKFHEFELVSIEPYLDGKFELFEFGSSSHYNAVVAHAFSHYTWLKSRGEFVITGLKGVQQLNKYNLTIPTIHSRSQKFVHTDKGYKGIEDFFSTHRCNDLCRVWPRPDNVLQRPKLSNSEIDMMSLQLQNMAEIQPKGAAPAAMRMSVSDMYLMRNYPIRTGSHQDSRNCACSYFGLQCSHKHHPVSMVMCTTRSALENDVFL